MFFSFQFRQKSNVRSSAKFKTFFSVSFYAQLFSFTFISQLLLCFLLFFFPLFEALSKFCKTHTHTFTYSYERKKKEKNRSSFRWDFVWFGTEYNPFDSALWPRKKNKVQLSQAEAYKFSTFSTQVKINAHTLKFVYVFVSLNLNFRYYQKSIRVQILLFMVDIALTCDI